MVKGAIQKQTNWSYLLYLGSESLILSFSLSILS